MASQLLDFLDLTLSSNNSIPTHTSREQNAVEVDIAHTYRLEADSFGSFKLAREDHMFYLMGGLRSLPGQMRALDARFEL